MKSWFVFGFGLVLGAVMGAFFTMFILFDDVTQRRSPTAPSVVATAKSKLKKARSSLSPSSIEAKPTAIAAEAVDLDSLPPAEEGGVMATVKREDAAVP